ncbi:tetratricopeptide repeat protein [Streptomyces sp. NPDC002734]|uniref:tetratricopeptide repeat protein n=1 Tax=Streptomyces sp. NPDC002734 TaxID=3154426 RepID=UPI003319CFB1
MRDPHRQDAENLLDRTVKEEARRSGTDPAVLLTRARAALDGMARAAEPEYQAYLRALDAARDAHPTFARRFAREGGGPTTFLVAGVAAATATVADLALGTGGAVALGAGISVGLTATATAVVRVTASHVPAAHHHAGAVLQPGGHEALRLQWLTALELRGIRPWLEQHRRLAAPPRTPTAPPRLRGTDKSAAARRRAVLERSFDQLPPADAPFAGRREELAAIRRWARAARADADSRPTVVVLHGALGSGRTALAARAAHDLRDEYRGACLVDLRGDSPSDPPLPTRQALLHLLNRLGAPREQLLFREGSTPEQQLTRLTELYRRHLAGLPVIVVLDDASDPEQVRALLPERSESLVLVTSRTPLALLRDMPAHSHQLAVQPLPVEASREALAAYTPPGAERAQDDEATERVHRLCGGLPLALRVAGTALGARGAARLADDLGAYGPVTPVQRALWLRYSDQPEQARRLLRRLALAGRASLGAAAAASLLDTDERDAWRHLASLARAGLVEPVRGTRCRLHDVVRAFAQERLQEEETPAERTAAQTRLITTYAALADSVLRLIDGNISTRTGLSTPAGAAPQGFSSLKEALRWLDDESAFITAALRNADGVDSSAVHALLGALCDYCLLRGDMYRLGEINELARSVDEGLMLRSVTWRTGIAARQIGDLDKARSTLSSLVDDYRASEQEAEAARAMGSLGITLHHQGNLPEAAAKLREAVNLQGAPELSADRAWTLHALGAVERDRGNLAEARQLLRQSLALHRAAEAVHGEAWARYQFGQLALRAGDVERGRQELRAALDGYRRTRDTRGQAWTRTQLERARLADGEAAAAVEGLRKAVALHREVEDLRGEAWTLHYLGQALEETGDLDEAGRELERSRALFSRMRDVYGLGWARHHLARVTRDQRAARAGSLRNSGFARQLLVDARADFRRAGVVHGEAWSCVELAVIDAGNSREERALALCDEAVELAAACGDVRAEGWARFLRCTLLPYAAADGATVAQRELAELLPTVKDPRLADCAATWELYLRRGLPPGEAWAAWRLGLTPTRAAREILG